MRIICPQCRTIYQLSSVDPDAILVCHRCGTEFGMGEAPEGAQQVDAVSIPDADTRDLFAGMGFDEATTDEPGEAESAAESETGMKADSAAGTGDNTASVHQPGEGVEHEQQAEAAETQTARDISTDDVDLDALSDDYPEHTPEPDDAASLDDFTDVDLFDADTPEAAQAYDDIASPIIPSRDSWQESTPMQPGNSGNMMEQEDLRGPESVYFEEDEPLPPPPRRKARILPWLIVVLLVLFGAGLWMNYSTWMNDPWLRSVLINAGLNLEIRDKDWHIDPASVSAEWLKREDGNAVLVIHGVVHNLLQTDVTPPRIHLTLFARNNPRLVILERDLVITRPPLMESIRQSSYVAPLPDNTPVAALGKRDFVLVLDDLPENAGNFSLSPKAR